MYDCKHLRDYGNKCLSIRAKKMCSSCRNEEKQFHEAFSVPIHPEHINMIRLIKDNVRVGKFEFDTAITDIFTDQAWTLFGRYLSNNTHMHTLNINVINMMNGNVLNGGELTDNKMICLFGGLVGSVSLKSLGLNQGVFGVDGLRSMMQFLHNSPKLNELNIGSNNNLNSECFEVVLRSLACRGGIQKLNFMSANITDISALEAYKINCLQDLNLSCNNIGREGIMILSNILQQEDSSLTTLDISSTGSGDEEAEILATALKRNANLIILHFENNCITEKGVRLLLEVLLDLSSIDSTYNSNYTL